MKTNLRVELANQRTKNTMLEMKLKDADEKFHAELKSSMDFCNENYHLKRLLISQCECFISILKKDVEI